MLQTVTDWTTGSAGTVYWTANTQGLAGQVTQDTLGNGVVTNRSFDAVTGWLNSIQSAVGGGTGLQNQSYLYDAIGNVTQRQENTLGLTESFYYDNLYRLDYSTLNNGGGAATNLDLTYDAMGNITARSDVNGGATWTYHSTRKHAVATTGSGGASYSYNANGNMVSRDGATIGWASYNYPIYLAKGTETSQFVYGPDRQYYKQVYTDTGASVSETTYYIGGLVEKVDDGATIDWRHSIIANGQIVAIVSRKSTSTNAVHYQLEDHQGSGSTLTSSSGTLVARESFNAFGLPRDGADWDGAVPSGDQATINAISRRGYTGHSMLGAMGLIHMNGRVQDAVTGRFLSADPTIPNPGFTQSYHRYAYVNNNPLSYIDPSGFDETVLGEVNVIATRLKQPSGCIVRGDCNDSYTPPTPFDGPFSLEQFCAQALNGTCEQGDGGIQINIRRMEHTPQTPIPCKPGVQCRIPTSCSVNDPGFPTPTMASLGYSESGPGSWGMAFRHWSEAQMARDLGHHAIAARQALYGPTSNGHDLPNGFQHTYWHFLMAQEFGAPLAIQMGDAHERDVPTQRGDMLMDLYNNRFGAGLGAKNPSASRQDAVGMVQKAISEGCVRTSSF